MRLETGNERKHKILQGIGMGKDFLNQISKIIKGKLNFVKYRSFTQQRK